MTDKDKGGRPTDYNDELAVDICNHIAGGKSLRSFCRGERAPHISTVCRWLHANEGFSSKYKKARSSHLKKNGVKWSVSDRAKSVKPRKLVKDEVDYDRVIYLVRCGNTNFYKVGITNKVSRRLKDLQSSNPHEIILIATCIGNKNKEYELQNMMSDFWVRGEWFSIPDEHIGILVDEMEGSDG